MGEACSTGLMTNVYKTVVQKHECKKERRKSGFTWGDNITTNLK